MGSFTVIPSTFNTSHNLPFVNFNTGAGNGTSDYHLGGNILFDDVQNMSGKSPSTSGGGGVIPAPAQEMLFLKAMSDMTTDMGLSPLVYDHTNLSFPNLTDTPGCRNGSNATNCTFFTLDTTEDFHDFYKTAQFVTGLICCPIICAYGLLGNIFILIVLRQKAMHTSTNVYLSALAVSDILKLVNDSLYFLTILLFETAPDAGNKAFGYLYPYAHFIFNMSVCVSSWLTVSVAVERYLLVCHPIKSKTLTTIPRAKWISSICFFVMTAVAVPSALRYRTVEEVVFENGVNKTMLDVKLTELWKDQQFVVSYNWLQSLLRSIIPLFVLVVMNGFIINALRKTRANKKQNKANKITIMLCIVIIFFLVCIIPDAVMSAFFNLGYVESDNYLVKGVREVTDMLLALNAAMNFILYIIFNKIFRDHFVQLFCGRCVKEKNKEDAQYRRLNEGKKLQTNGVNKNANKPAKNCQVETTDV